MLIKIIAEKVNKTNPGIIVFSVPIESIPHLLNHQIFATNLTPYESHIEVGVTLLIEEGNEIIQYELKNKLLDDFSVEDLTNILDHLSD